MSLLNYYLNGTSIDNIGINYLDGEDSSEGVILDDKFYSDHLFKDVTSYPYPFTDFVDLSSSDNNKQWFNSVKSGYGNSNYDYYLLKYGSCPDFWNIGNDTTSNSFNYVVYSNKWDSGAWISVSKMKLYFNLQSIRSCDAIVVERTYKKSNTSSNASWFYIYYTNSSITIDSSTPAYLNSSYTEKLHNPSWPDTSTEQLNFFEYINMKRISGTTSNRIAKLQDGAVPSALVLLLWAGGGGGGKGLTQEYSPSAYNTRVDGSGGGGGAMVPIVIALDKSFKLSSGMTRSYKYVFNLPKGGEGGKWSDSTTAATKQAAARGTKGGNMVFWVQSASGATPAYGTGSTSSLSNADKLFTLYGGSGGTWYTEVASGGAFIKNYSSPTSRYVYGITSGDYVSEVDDNESTGLDGGDGGKGGGAGEYHKAGSDRPLIKSTCNPFILESAYTNKYGVNTGFGGLVYPNYVESEAGGGGGGSFGKGGHGGGSKDSEFAEHGKYGAGGGGATYYEELTHRGGSYSNDAGDGGDGGVLILY